MTFWLDSILIRLGYVYNENLMLYQLKEEDSTSRVDVSFDYTADEIDIQVSVIEPNEWTSYETEKLSSTLEKALSMCQMRLTPEEGICE